MFFKGNLKTYIFKTTFLCIYNCNFFFQKNKHFVSNFMIEKVCNNQKLYCETINFVSMSSNLIKVILRHILVMMSVFFEVFKVFLPFLKALNMTKFDILKVSLVVLMY